MYGAPKHQTFSLTLVVCTWSSPWGGSLSDSKWVCFLGAETLTDQLFSDPFSCSSTRPLFTRPSYDCSLGCVTCCPWRHWSSGSWCSRASISLKSFSKILYQRLGEGRQPLVLPWGFAVEPTKLVHKARRKWQREPWWVKILFRMVLETRGIERRKQGQQHPRNETWSRKGTRWLEWRVTYTSSWK